MALQEYQQRRGEETYARALRTMVGRVKQSGFKGAPESYIEEMPKQVLGFIQEMLPGINLEEATIIVGSMISLGLAAHVRNAGVDPKSLITLTEGFHTSLSSGLPGALAYIDEINKQQKAGAKPAKGNLFVIPGK